MSESEILFIKGSKQFLASVRDNFSLLQPWLLKNRDYTNNAASLDYLR